MLQQEIIKIDSREAHGIAVKNLLNLFLNPISILRHE